MSQDAVHQPPIVLNEYQETWVDLDLADLAYVEQVLQDRISVARPFHGDGYLLNPNQFAGIVVLPSGRRIECRPKVPIGNFFVMLAIAFDLDPDFLQETTTYQRISEIFEFVIEYFAELVDRRINRGLYRSYVEREENLLAVRGRIVVGEDIRRNHILRHRTFCRFTELTWDIPENQIVRQVAHMTAGWVDSRELRDELRRIDRMLAEVAPVTLPARAIDRFSYGRLNDDYRPIHALCRLFLEGSSVSEEAGEFDFRTFLFDMNVLFERFVTRLIAHRVPPDVAVDPQAKITLGTLNEVTMFPDILLRCAGRASAAIDCKYKRLDTWQYKNHDQYQVLAYCTALDVTRGMLVYPRHEVALDQTIHVRNSNIHIRQISIDLGGDRLAFDASCREFVARVAAWARAAPPSLPHAPEPQIVGIPAAS